MGATLDTYAIIFLLLSLFLSLSLFLVLFNLKLTIKVLKKEILRYKKIIVSYQTKEANFKNNADLSLYQNIKKNINVLKNDLIETDFNNFDSIKEEIILALEEIDYYAIEKNE